MQAINQAVQKVSTFYCSICETRVMKNTKHCAICNRCCHEFDHHCMWVGNDIGRHNYIYFMRMLLWTIACLSCSVVISIAVLCKVSTTEEYVDGIEIDGVPSKQMERVDRYKQTILSRSSLIGLNIATSSLGILAMMFVIYLMRFHAWLIRNNLTTFKWIKSKENRGDSKIVTQVVKVEIPSQTSDFSEQEDQISSSRNSSSNADR